MEGFKSRRTEIVRCVLGPDRKHRTALTKRAEVSSDQGVGPGTSSVCRDLPRLRTVLESQLNRAPSLGRSGQHGSGLAGADGVVTGHGIGQGSQRGRGVNRQRQRQREVAQITRLVGQTSRQGVPPFGQSREIHLHKARAHMVLRDRHGRTQGQAVFEQGEFVARHHGLAGGVRHLQVDPDRGCGVARGDGGGAEHRRARAYGVERS